MFNSWFGWGLDKTSHNWRSIIPRVTHVLQQWEKIQYVSRLFWRWWRWPWWEGWYLRLLRPELPGCFSLTTLHFRIFGLCSTERTWKITRKWSWGLETTVVSGTFTYCIKKNHNTNCLIQVVGVGMCSRGKGGGAGSERQQEESKLYISKLVQFYTHFYQKKKRSQVRTVQFVKFNI